MFRVLDIDPEGVATSHDGDVDERLRPPTAGHFRFIDCLAPTADELSTLQERFGFHPVAIEDCAQYDRRPKFEAYDDHWFIVIHALGADPNEPDRVEARELHAFLAVNYLVMVHDEVIDGVDSVRKRLQLEPQLARRGPAYAYYLVADGLAASVFPWIEELIARIENAEDGLFEASGESALNDAYTIRRLLASIRRVLAPQREVFSAISKLESPILGKKVMPFYRSVLDDVMRLTELVETTREHVSNLREAHVTAMSQRTNAVIHRLTVLSAIFLPLTFITGFFGQNFETLPFSSHELFYAALAITVATPTAMLVWFRRRGWW
jgi:magnesium transporter